MESTDKNGESGTAPRTHSNVVFLNAYENDPMRKNEEGNIRFEKGRESKPSL